MNTLSTTDALIIVLLVALLTFLTRYLPFVLFGNLKSPSLTLSDLGRVLPQAVIAILVIYCLRHTGFDRASSFLPQLIAVTAVVLLHLWKRNNLISIGGGTAIYMVLVQLVWTG